MTHLRLATALIVILVGCSLLTGCTGNPAGVQGNGKSYDTAQLDCAGYLTIPEADRSKALRYPEGFPEYTATGVTQWKSARQFYDVVCKKATNSKKIIDRLNPSVPSCSGWEPLPDSVKLAWIRAEVPKDATPDADALTTVAAECKILPASQSDDFLNAAIVLYKNARQKNSDDTDAAALPRQTTWTTTSKLGYTIKVLLQAAASALPSNLKTHPLDDKTTVGTACGYDPKTDIAIPAQMLATNTASSEAPVQSAVALVHSGSHTATSLAVTTGYIDSGSYCSQEQNGSASLNTQQSKPVKTGESRAIMFFVTIKNYYSPRYPSGAAQELADYQLIATQYTGTTLDDPIAQITPSEASISLSQ